jgi:hypothetical protein
VAEAVEGVGGGVEGVSVFTSNSCIAGFSLQIGGSVSLTLTETTLSEELISF